MPEMPPANRQRTRVPSSLQFSIVTLDWPPQEIGRAHV